MADDPAADDANVAMQQDFSMDAQHTTDTLELSNLSPREHYSVRFSQDEYGSEYEQYATSKDYGLEEMLLSRQIPPINEPILGDQEKLGPIVYTAGIQKQETAKKRKRNKVTRMSKGPKPSIKYTPSSYLAEMKLSTAEKLALTSEACTPKIVELLDAGALSYQKDCAVDMDQVLLQPFPSEAFFQQYEPHQTYEFPIAFRNNDKVARYLKVTHDDSPYFKIVCQKMSGSKVAPGMEALYSLLFMPDENKDYTHELVCITDREKFIIPVKAIGARGLLDFLDEIHFSSAPVKYASTRTVLVRNVGNNEAKFNIKTEKPFSVDPADAVLETNTCMQVNVGFKPLKVGDHRGELVIHYDTGEDVYVQLYGSATDVNVRLDKSSIMLDNTFIGLSSQRTVTIHNRSNVVVHYAWKTYSSVEEEEAQKQLRTKQMDEEESLSKESFFARCLHNPAIRDRYPILTRHLERNRKHFLEDEKHLYSDDNICIDPVEGEIWPNSQADVSVIFKPGVASSYSRVTFCDVTGRETRLPLRLKGEGMGPKMQFSFDTLDIQNIFVNSSHAYEVVLENKGDIDGVYNLVPSQTLFGPKFVFTPSSGVLKPGMFQAIQISFCSSVLGEVNETFQWKVEGLPFLLQLKMKGTVIGPTFNFNVPEVKFGTISYGFLEVQEVSLSNTSEVPMTYQLRVPGDGMAFGKDGHRVREFIIKPSSGVLPPNYMQPIKIKFTPAFVKKYACAVVVDVEEAGKEVFSLPVTARSVVPAIALMTPLLEFGRCFVHHPYVKNVELRNDSGLPAKYEMPPQVGQRAGREGEGERGGDQPLIYSTTTPKGIIKASSKLSVPLQIETQIQGDISTFATFNILGNASALEVELRCIGEGPVISVTPVKLAWGPCQVLIPVFKKVMLSNESLIPAEFECAFANEKTIFTVEPFSAVIPPQGKLELNVTALIDDCIKFTDKLTIVVAGGVSFTVSLSAEGKGTTIVSHPPLQPEVNLGPHFSKGPCEKKFTLLNRGRRVQALSWTTEGFSAQRMKKIQMERQITDNLDVALKKQPPLRRPELKMPLFHIVPDKFVLEPYQSHVLTLKGYSPEPQFVHERLICHAIIGKNPHKERIMTVDVKADFIAPLLEFSARELVFTVHQPPGSRLKQHTQAVDMKNVSPLPVNAVLLCGYPFSLISKGSSHAEMGFKLSPGEDTSITVQYDSTYCVDKHTRHENNLLDVAYKEHPQKDSIQLKADVHFPNLEFETTEVDFGCILNDTETMCCVTMANCSPLEVKYSWSFLKRPPPQRVDPEQHDEGVDMQSECESDSLDGEEGEEGEGGEEEGEGGEGGEGGEEEEGGVEQGVVGGGVSRGAAGSVCSREEGSGASEGQSQAQGTVEQALEEAGAPQDTVAVLSIPQVVGDESDTSREERSSVGDNQHRSPPQPVAADPFVPIRIDQIFDILPLHGLLLPGQSQQVQFSFHGHSDVTAEVMAACRVEGGPTYQLRLIGEASEVQYRFSKTVMDIGKQLYNQLHYEEIVLYNSGKVDVDYSVIGVTSDNRKLFPAQIAVSPLTGHIPALENQTFKVCFYPGVPEVFNKTFKIQVAHLEPCTITVTGEGVFPCIAFNLPRDLTSVEQHSTLREKASVNLSNESLKPDEDSSEAEAEKGLELEMDRILVKEHAELYFDKVSSTEQGKRTSKVKPVLPEFILDCGFVIYGQVVSFPVKLSNIGYCPVSFATAHSALQNTGFSVDLGDRIKALPGAPDFESLDFVVRFDPASANCGEGLVEAQLPFSLVGGPVYVLKMVADVTKPKLELSRSHVDFGTVLCGQYKIITIRLNNPFSVKCEWTAVTDKPPKKIPRHVPLHVRKKMKEKPPPSFFEVEPASGVLMPGQNMDVQVGFMPSEEMHYVEKIPFAIKMNQDSGIVLGVEGLGSEPQIQFDRTLVEFPPVFPFALGSEVEITVTNPAPYPVGFYSLEFDKQYLEEEQILRWVKGYDRKKRLFLPPVEAGGKLPQEILDAYDREQKEDLSKKTTSLTEVPSEEVVYESTVNVEQTSSQAKIALPPTSITNILKQKVGAYETKGSSTALLPSLTMIGSVMSLSNVLLDGQQGTDISPAAAAIAHYLGIDTSPEAALAANRRGIAVIIHGPPHGGKTTQAEALGKEYDAAVLDFDEVLIESISSASTPGGYKAREFCIHSKAEPEVLLLPSAPTTASQRKLTTVKELDPTPIPPPVDPPQEFEVDPLPDSPLAVPEGKLLTAKLPEDVIVEILAEKLQQRICYCGVIFDGINSKFTSSVSMTTALILRALNNRKHIFFVQLNMELISICGRLEHIKFEEKRRAEEEALAVEAEKEKERERIQALLELPEDEYEKLPDEQKLEIDQKRLEIYKDKKRKMQKEKEEQERLKREKAEEEEKRLEEEKLRRKGRLRDTKQKQAPPAKPTALAAVAAVATVGGTSSRMESSGVFSQPGVSQALGGTKVTTSIASVMSGSETPTPKKKNYRKASARFEDGNDEIKEQTPLQKQYSSFENNLVGVHSVLEDWDRNMGMVRPKVQPEEETIKLQTPAKKSSRSKQKEAALPPAEPQEVKPPAIKPKESREGVGVPCVSVDGTMSKENITMRLCKLELTTPKEILESLGMGPDGPPIPKSVVFQVYPYPLKRRHTETLLAENFSFITSSPDDPNGPQEDTSSSSEQQEEQLAASIAGTESSQPPSRVGRKTATQMRSPDIAEHSSHKRSSQRLAGGKKKSSFKSASPLPLEEQPSVEGKSKPEMPSIVKLVKFRWVVPAKSQVTLKLLFSSTEQGQYDQTLNFEIVGTRQRHQLFCRGICAVPTICREPKIVFQNRKGSCKKGEIVQKRFILDENVYAFGPLHCGKTRERYREGRYPENLETLTICNTSLMESEVFFYFQFDANAATFLVDPPNMTLQPGQSKDLTIWAYPKSPSDFRDALVCCIRHNPDPVVFDISCIGVEPDLKVDKKLLEFKKVLLHRCTEGGLDFQSVRVFDDHKLAIQLKNKGKYDIAYNIVFESSAHSGVDYSKMFSMSQSRSNLYPSDKAHPVHITFKPDREIIIKDQPILKCQVVDIHVGEHGEVIANIPIKVSAKAVFSKFKISPINDINFGSMVIGTRKTYPLLLENKGDFDFKYAITNKLAGEHQKQRVVLAAAAANRVSRSREGMNSMQSSQVFKPGMMKQKAGDTSLRTEVVGGIQKLTLGMFTVYSATGTVGANQSQQINVECMADRQGKHTEELLIEISDRHKDGPPVYYKLYGEVFMPSINVTDFPAIFEEHRVCKRLGVLGQHKFHEDGCVGVFGEEEHRFVFKSVIVGRTSMARFKIINPNKIHCDVNVSIKPVTQKAKGHLEEVFDVEPSKLTIPSHSHLYVSTSFKPTAMQCYSAIFEASIDGPTQSKGKSLSFELQGEGNLPQVAVVRPTLRNAAGQYVLLFKRLLLGRCQVVPITLENTGTIHATIVAENHSKDNSYSISMQEASLQPQESSNEEKGEGSEFASVPVSMELAVGEKQDLLVMFQPNSAKRCSGLVHLRIKSNQFENLSIQLVGEGYEDDVSIENIRGRAEETSLSEEEVQKMANKMEAAQENHLYFGGCPVGESRQMTFTLSNHCSNNVVKFQWPNSGMDDMVFSPSVGHLHPKRSKDIVVTFKPSKPQVITAQKAFGRACRISFSQPISQIADWDDRMKSVRWVNVASSQNMLAASTASPATLPVATATTPAPSTPGGALLAAEETPSVSSTLQPPSQRPGNRPPATPAKQKVVETDPEPAHSVVDNSQREIELFVSAVSDRSKYECLAKDVKFRDTLMYQTRVYSFPLKNVSNIPLAYEWALLDSDSVPVRLPSQVQLHLNEEGSIVSEGEEVAPFSITPCSGEVQPEMQETFSIRFSPLDVGEMAYIFKCNIPYLDPSCEPLEVKVSGHSLMPYCHFDLEESEYIRSRTTGVRGNSLEPNTRAIEFHSCGVGVKTVKQFNIVNPTASGYDYLLVNEDEGLSPATLPFKCLTPKGFVGGGRKQEIVFEFLPSGVDLVESLWRFSIPSLSISLPFLLVGITVEPAVNMDRAYIRFKPMLVGSQLSETVYLLNNESIPYHFAFVEKTRYSDGHIAKLDVKPMSGVIQPKSKLPVEVSVIATKEQEFNFNLHCQVKRKPSPAVLNVKAEGYAINVSLSCKGTQGEEFTLAIGRASKATIDMGEVQVNDKSLWEVFVFNTGSYSFEYKWELSERCRRKGGQDRQLVSISAEEGVAGAHDRIKCELIFSPPSKVALRGCELVLNILNGPSIPVVLKGRGIEPNVEFSFTEHDFGPCFIHHSEMDSTQATLAITNHDTKYISMACLFNNKPHLEVIAEPQFLAPKVPCNVVIKFQPKDAVKYCEQVVFEINALCRKTVTFKGEGAKMKIEVANLNQKIINFGTLRVGNKVSKSVKLLNHSPITTTFLVYIVPSSSAPALQQAGVLSVSPGEVSIPPHGSSLISVNFSPKARVSHFTEEVTLEYSGVHQPLLMVSGSCQGLEIVLDGDHLPFGAVVLKSQSKRRLLMLNSGDIGARFHWEHEKFAPDFSISPVEGYISSGMEVTFDITFHPVELNQDIRYERIPCHIEGSKPLHLTLTGVCIEQIPLKEVIHFTASVRSKESRQLTIPNKTNSHWLLKPIIDGEYWIGPESLSIEPNHSRHYELTYEPLRMTTELQKHQGSIFFPLPDGTGLLYNLLGTAEPPKNIATIQQDIPCKTKHTELLTVENWLRRPQRFHVFREMIRPEKLDSSVTLELLDYIDVPALSKRDYKVKFYSFKECSIFFKVVFKNEQTGEYLFYHVNFKSTPPGIIGTVELRTPVRKCISHVINIENPLRSNVTFTNSTNVPELISFPPTIVFGAQGTGKFMFEFLPLKVGKTQGKLTLSSSDLGVYQYELHLVATDPPQEKAVHFTTTLGSSSQQSCKFTSYAKGRTEYVCKVDSGDFHVDKTVTVASAGSSGTEATVEVVFEPSHLGDAQTTLTISSPSGGDYVIPLFGHCLVPKPQGPYIIKAGSSVSIPFKNIFSNVKQFNFSVDNPVFTVKASDNLKARKTHNIVVMYDAKQADPHVAKMGKLVVTSQQSSKSVGGISWIYYLKGVPH